MVFYSKNVCTLEKISCPSCPTIICVGNGVRQEGILSPYIFCVYMEDLSNKLNNVNTGCIIGSSLINDLMYADNVVLMTPSSMGLSMLLYMCSENGIEHDIKYSSAKSKVMIFCCKRFKDIHIPNVVLNGETLPRVNKCKYLGHIITEDLSGNNDMSRQYKIISAQDSALSRKFYMCTESANVLYLNAIVLHYYASCGVAIEQSQ